MLTAHEGSSDAAFQVKITKSLLMFIGIIVLVLVVIIIIFATTVIIFKTTTIIMMGKYVQELNKAQLKPFLMRIWGQVGRTELSNEDGIICRYMGV